ncbi:MAG: four helix bundle protein [Chloroflexi bacterium]|nr:four helix bundle protein [Chloroflexota bacterium]
MPDKSNLILPHGGYRKLRSFRCAEAVYDATAVFCDRFVDRRSRTYDQMVQAARSGVQNIAEGSMASATSKKTELKLTSVARASLEELLLDYQDFLRQRGQRLWDKDSPEALAVRRSLEPDPNIFRTANAEVAANTLVCLINQASFLLGRQIRALEQQFVEHGGFTERLYDVRAKERGKSDGSDTSDASDRSDSSDGPSPPPLCPRCGKPMVRRVARQGARVGQPFWGCSAYPECSGTRAAQSHNGFITRPAGGLG